MNRPIPVVSKYIEKKLKDKEQIKHKVKFYIINTS